jgi:hypothetical protein
MKVTVKRSKSETAKSLAKAHFRNEPKLKLVRLVEPLNESDPSDPIKLLEVVEGTIERGIEPIAFPANPRLEIDYPVLIIEVSPREYQDILNNATALNARGWTMGTELPAI